MDPKIFFLIGWGGLGAVVGSFLNAFVYRWPRKISLLKVRRSFCPACNAVIAWHDNIPILSYLVLLGRCRRCRARIPIRYLAVELLSTGLFALSYYRGIMVEGGGGWPFVLVASFVSGLLIAAAFTDIECYLIPNVTTDLLIALGLGAALFFPSFLHLGFATAWTRVSRLDGLLDSVQGMVLGGGLVWAIGAAAELLIRKEAMGAGDARLLAGVGALLGWKAATAAFFMAPFLGCLVGIPVLVYDAFAKKRGRGEKERGITYKYEPEEKPPSDEETAKRRGPLKLGLLVSAEQAGLLVWFLARTGTPPGARGAGASAILGARTSEIAATAPLLFGLALGLFMVFYDVVRFRLMKEGRWTRRDVRVAEDGSAEEKLSGHYLPFGPFLVAAGLVTLFFREEILSGLSWYLFGMR